MEEQISKAKALELFEKGLLDVYEVGTFRGLAGKLVQKLIHPTQQVEGTSVFSFLKKL